MTFDFIDVETNEPVELWLKMSEAPKLDEVIEYEGRRLKRVVSQPQINKEFKPYVSRNVQPGLAIKHGAKVNEKGHPVIDSRALERTIAKSEKLGEHF